MLDLVSGHVPGWQSGICNAWQADTVILLVAWATGLDRVSQSTQIWNLKSTGAGRAVSSNTSRPAFCVVLVLRTGASVLVDAGAVSCQYFSKKGKHLVSLRMVSGLCGR
jgi:hypothetical protein